MDDRFKFRCGIIISHYDDDENDIETLLLVNNVTIYDDGEVGFDRESLKEAVKKKNLSEEEERTLWNSLDEYEVFEDWYQMPADFIEQCTGLKDKNGKPIYEGDILFVKALDWKKKERWNAGEVKTYWSVEYKDYWNHRGFMVFGINRRFHKPLTRTAIFNSEAIIVGNIHENQKLLKELK